MKKIFVILFIITFCITLSTNIFAEEDTKKIMNEDMVNLMKNQIDEKSYQAFFDENMYSDKELYQKMKNSPIMLVYDIFSWNLDGEPYTIDEIIENRKNEIEKYYYIFAENEIICVSQNTEGHVKLKLSFTENKIPQYLLDIKNQSLETTIQGTDCTIKQIFLFEGISMPNNVFLFYITDKGTFVNCYDSDGILDEYTYEEFQIRSKEYTEFLTSNKNPYKKAEGFINFADFDTRYLNSNNEYKFIWVWGCIGVLILGGGILAFVKVLKSKKT